MRIAGLSRSYSLSAARGHRISVKRDGAVSGVLHAALREGDLLEVGPPQGRFTLVFLAAPPEMRARVLGILSMCIGAGLIGFIGLGLLAEAIGAPAATVATGLAGLAVLAATWPLWRRI